MELTFQYQRLNCTPISARPRRQF